MKQLLFFWAKRLLNKVLFPGLMLIILLFINTLNAQVSFIQTLNADFNKGVLNNTVVSSDNIYLQYAANDVGNWLTTTVLPQTLSGHKTVSWNDRYVYMIGGYNNVNCVNTVYVATIQSGGISGWTSLNPLPVALRDPAVVIGTNTIYVMGGRDTSQVFNTIYYASLNTDGSIGAWQTSSVTLPANLWGHTATYLMGYIYIIGGSGSMTENTALNTVYFTKVNALNTLSSFTSGTNLATARNRHSSITYNNKIYVLGGYDNSGIKSNTVYIATPALNGTTGAWSSGTNLPVAISNHSAVVTNGMITVMAGAVGTSLSNNVYYAKTDTVSLGWITSSNVMYDFTKDGSAFAGNGLVFYTGGLNLSGTPIINCRYALMSMSSNYVKNGSFVSNPFYELGAERIIDSLNFLKTYTAPANLQLTYRTAGSDGIWSNWSTLLSSSPIIIGQSKQYLQYAAILTGSATLNAALNEIKLYTPGTQLSGNINTITTFTKALSPYWATTDISFTAGTHTFQAGATILFLPNTGLSVSQANIICNGTAIDSVKFTYFTNETGKWNGIYFDENSDVSVSSQFYYTVISNAGNGSRNANLSCYATSEPLLSNCNIRNADGNGISLNSAHISIQNTVIKGNTENGMYLNNSNPNMITDFISYNGNAGILITSASSLPNFASTIVNNNLYAFFYPTSNITLSKFLGSLTLTNNTYNGICLPGGQLTDNYRWNSLSFPIFIMDNLYIGKCNSLCRLTIEPGNTIKIAAGKTIQLGFNFGCTNAGELYAIGTLDSMIMFTSINGVSGGWEGLYFEDRSDVAGAVSVMDYCIIEKGNNYNIYCENTYQPNINHCILRNAVKDGLKFYGAYNTLSNSTISNNGRYPIYFSEPHTYPVLTGNTYTANTINLIGYCGGNLSSSRTLQNDGIGYHIMDNIMVGQCNTVSRLTVSKGLNLFFATGKGIQIGFYSGCTFGGELYAVGSIDSMITFTPYSGTAGDWNGIYFADQSDVYGNTNQLIYCNIQKANAYNIYLENTSSVTIENCNISNAVTDGLRLYGAYGSFTNCNINNNGRYPVNYLEWSSNPVHNNNTYLGNGINLIALPGGSYTENRTLTNDGINYLVLDNIMIGTCNNVRRLTIDKGLSLFFASGKGIQVGFYSGCTYGGELYAIGTVDSIISFGPYSGIAGDWNGIYFTDQSDVWGNTNQLKYCTIQKGNAYNVYCENTSSVTIDHCALINAITDGLKFNASSGSFTSCTINNNGRYPVNYMDWTSNPVHTANTFTGNGINLIALSGGIYTESRTISNDGINYLILDNITIGRCNEIRRLTIEKGLSLFFASGKGIQIGYFSGCTYGGELYAIGTADSIINFKPYSGIVGDWSGLYFVDQSDVWGATCSLKYCTIEKGNLYNIKSESTTMPLIEHCDINRSTAYGIHISNSTLTIRNSLIHYNTSYGIYIDGSSSANIGNIDSMACSLYNNGGFQLYNNSTSDVNAGFNYWGSSDSTMISYKIYDKSDNLIKGRVLFSPYLQLPSLFTTNTQMSGSIKYANTAANPIKNASMLIKNFSDSVIATTSSNTSGLYSFSPFPSGNYKMTITPAAPWGGVNSTDALLILNHFAKISTLAGMNLAAADVNNSHTINGTDAMLVMKRYSGLLSSFPSGDYLFNTDSLIENGNQLTNNIKMICYGDVNATYAPAKKSSSSVGLLYEGNLIVDSFTEFDFPIKLKTGMQLAATSLGFYYPKQFLDITGVQMINGITVSSWTAVDGLFRMGWCDLNPLNINDDGLIVILKMKAKNLIGLTNNISLDIIENCELANSMAIPNEWAVISIPLIQKNLTGILQKNTMNNLSVYPNPVCGNSLISFSLDKPGNINIELLDIVGNQISVIIDKNYSAGNYKVEFNSYNLNSGIYFLKFTNTNKEQSNTEMIKLFVSY